MSPRYVAVCLLSCLFVSLLPRFASATEGVGRVLLAAGDTTAIRDGRVVRLARGSLIEPKDLLRTGRDSSLQVRMTDSGILSLRPDSSLSIEQYVYRGQPDGNENAVFRLLRGGFRTITGLIGRVNKSAYRVNTGVATIGIRGTAYALALCDAGACQSGSGSSAADGLYGTVTEGQITAANQVAESTFKAGDTFFASAPDAQFQRLLAPPPFLAAQVSRQKPNEKESAEDDGQTAANGADGSRKQSQAGRTSQDGEASRRPAQSAEGNGPEARQSGGVERKERRAAAVARRVENARTTAGTDPARPEDSTAPASSTSPGDTQATATDVTTTTTGQASTDSTTTLKLTEGTTSVTTETSTTLKLADGTTAVTTDTSTTLKLTDSTASVTTDTSTTLLSTSPITTTIAPLTTTAPTVISTETISSTGALSVLPAPDGFLVAYPHPGATYKVHFGDATEGQFTTANFLSRFFFATTDAGDLGAGNVVNKGSVAVGDQVITWGRWNGAVVSTPQGPVTGIPVLFVTANGVSGNSASTPFPSTLGSVTYVGGLGPAPSAVMPGFAPNQVIGSVSNESLQIDFTQQQAFLAMDMAFSASNTSGATFSRAYAVSGMAVPNSASTNAGDLSGSLGVSCTSGCGASSSATLSGSFNVGLTGPNGYEVAVTAGGISDTDASLSATFVRIFRAVP